MPDPFPAMRTYSRRGVANRRDNCELRNRLPPRSFEGAYADYQASAPQANVSVWSEMWIRARANRLPFRHDAGDIRLIPAACPVWSGSLFVM